MNEDWDVVLSFLPEDWQELARETGALKGLRKDKSVDALLRTLLLHLALRALAARDRGPGQEGEPGGSVRRGLVEASEEVGGLAARLVHRAVSRARDRDVGRWRFSGQSVRRNYGEGARPDRVAVAPALQRAPSVAGVRLLQAHGDRGSGRGRDVCAFSHRRGRLCARRPGLLDRRGPRPCGVFGRSRHRAGEHRVAAVSNV